MRFGVVLFFLGISSCAQAACPLGGQVICVLDGQRIPMAYQMTGWRCDQEGPLGLISRMTECVEKGGTVSEITNPQQSFLQSLNKKIRAGGGIFSDLSQAGRNALELMSRMAEVFN